MSWEKELNRELKKLKRAFSKMLLNSREFHDFRKKLKKLNLDGDIALEMYIIGKHDASLGTINRRKQKRMQLDKKDKEFLKTNGIIWD